MINGRISAANNSNWCKSTYANHFADALDGIEELFFLLSCRLFLSLDLSCVWNQLVGSREQFLVEVQIFICNWWYSRSKIFVGLVSIQEKNDNENAKKQENIFHSAQCVSPTEKRPKLLIFSFFYNFGITDRNSGFWFKIKKGNNFTKDRLIFFLFFFCNNYNSIKSLLHIIEINCLCRGI